MSDAPERVTADRARQAILDALIQAAQGYETQPFITQVYAYIDQTEAEVARLREAIKRIRFAVNSDSHAITFQTIGQYRTAILKVIAEETK